MREAVDAPLFVYNIPSTVKVKVEVETIVTLAAEGTVVGIKDSQGDFAFGRALVTRAAEQGAALRVMMGTQLIDTAVQIGADGAIPGVSNVAPADCVAAYEAATAGDWAAAGRRGAPRRRRRRAGQRRLRRRRAQGPAQGAGDSGPQHAHRPLPLALARGRGAHRPGARRRRPARPRRRRLMRPTRRRLLGGAGGPGIAVLATAAGSGAGGTPPGATPAPGEVRGSVEFMTNQAAAPFAAVEAAVAAFRQQYPQTEVQRDQRRRRSRTSACRR